ncbi:NAD(P)H-binding protein [Marinitenerispora sediminis]|uniref:Hydroxylase n=1 Tax=Marinitenerispora sediminis TaxID=1931232 RepID=A0A368T4E4_9ACTN|nr:NAD(P)H-binding protein [Marinitenerispora sediminis]RCV50354.1 hydroxylase [Marinitenerispora sediminis]RCV53631.1 hydroxylase [Marinitenerispora sediminis]RCV57926.1 hydroxylase [Marinitenerispora sediminis]
MTVLVTGATGNVGRPLVEQLLAAGHRVRALTRDPGRAGLPAGTEVVAGSLTDTESLPAAFAGVGAAHLITFGGRDYAPLTNGAEIVEIARKAGVHRVTVLKGDVAKSPLEEAVEAGGLDWTYLAPVEFMSNTLEWAESVRTEGTVREGFPDAESAMVHDADIAAVAAAALTSDGHAGQEYWLTGPEPLTVPQRVRTISEVLGREVRFVELSTDEVVAGWRAAGFSDDDVRFFLAMRTDPPISGRTVLPTVEEVTGRPARTFAQWMRENAAAFTA